VIEERLSIGMVIIRIIPRGEFNDAFLEFLMSSDYGVTCLDATCAREAVKMMLTPVTRSDLPHVIGGASSNIILTRSSRLRIFGILLKGFLQETGAGSHWLPAFVPELKKEEITCGVF
jgi:hypothetical protein